MSDSIIIRPQTQFKKTTYQVEYYDEFGRRRKKSKKTKGEAEDFRNLLIDQAHQRDAIKALKAQGIVLEGPAERKLLRKDIQDALAAFYQAKETVVLDPKDKTSLKLEKITYNIFGTFIIETQNRNFVDEITLDDMEKFRVHLQGRKIKNATVVRKENSIRAFLNYCIHHEYIEKNPMNGLRPMPVITPKRTKFEDGELEKLTDGLHEWVQEMFTVQQETIARNIELARVRFEDINWSGKEIKLVSAKGNRVHERFVPLTERALITLRAVAMRRHLEGRAKPTDILFRNSKGEPVTSNAYCLSIKKTRRALGLRDDLTAYVVRHDGCKLLRKLNVAQSYIGQFAGHRKASTTMHYFGEEREDMQNVVNIMEAAKKKKAQRVG